MVCDLNGMVWDLMQCYDICMLSEIEIKSLMLLYALRFVKKKKKTPRYTEYFQIFQSEQIIRQYLPLI